MQCNIAIDSDREGRFACFPDIRIRSGLPGRSLDPRACAGLLFG